MKEAGRLVGLSWASTYETQHNIATTGTNQGAVLRKGRCNNRGGDSFTQVNLTKGRERVKPAAAQIPPPSIANQPAIGYKQDNERSPASGP